MAYTPPVGPITLSFEDSYMPPSGSVTLRFGLTEPEIYIIRGIDSAIVASSPVAQIEQLTAIQGQAADIVNEAEQALIGEVFFISAEASTHVTSADQGLVEELRSISGHESVHVTSGNGEITKVIEFQGAFEANVNTCPSAQMGKGQIQDLPLGVDKSYRAPWEKAEWGIDPQKNMIWEGFLERDKHVNKPFRNTERTEGHTEIVWISGRDKIDRHRDIPWQDTLVAQISNGINYQNIMSDEDRHVNKPWGIFSKKHHTSRHFNYLIPGPKDLHKSIPWDMFFHSDTDRSFRYNQPGSNDKQHRTYWGPYWYSLLCLTTYYPPFSGENPPLRFSDHEEQTGQVTVYFNQPNNFRCPWTKTYSGPRDPYNPTIIFDDSILIVPVQGVYYMANSTYIKRISGLMEDIDFRSVSMSIDRGSWIWAFNVEILSEQSMALIKPQGSVLTDIEIYCNGWKWTCTVENWQENISFGRKSWTVTGKSQSVEIGEPYYMLPSYSNSEAQGVQIINDLLNGTGWDADWQSDLFDPAVDWLIPAGVINRTDTSLIKIVQQITGSVGAFLQTKADTNTSSGGTGSKILTIKPKYKANPWNWGTQVIPDAVLTDAICHEIGRRNNIMQPLNAAIVSGENTGVIVNAVKDGTAGDKAAPLRIDPLMTTIEAGRERTRHIISNSGFWIDHTLRLFSLMPPGEAPGLLLPGDFVDMNETAGSWRGQVKATSISSGWSQNGLETSQTIQVEQYIGG